MNLGRLAFALVLTSAAPGFAETIVRCDGLSRSSLHLRVEIACAEPGSSSRSILPTHCELVFIDVLDAESESLQTQEVFRLPVRPLPPAHNYRAFVSDEHDVDLTIFPRNVPFSTERTSEWLAGRREARLTLFYRDVFMITSTACEILESGR